MFGLYNDNESFFKAHGLKYQKITENGHCLYYAVAFFLKESQPVLRNHVAAYLEGHFEELSSSIALPHGNSLKQYLYDLRKGIEWAP